MPASLPDDRSATTGSRSTTPCSTTTSRGRRRAELTEPVRRPCASELVPLVARCLRGVRPAAGQGRHGRCDPRRRLPARPAEGLRRGGRGGGRLRLPARPARRHGAPVLHGHRPGRLPDHDPLRRARTSARPSSASCTRPATASTSRGCRPSTSARRWARRLAGRPRVAVAALGERGRPRPAVLGVLLPAGPADLPRGARRREPRPASSSPSTTSSRR